MSEQPREDPVVPMQPASIDELARIQNVREVRDLRDLAADIWGSDEELDAFLDDLRATRRASRG